MKDVTYGLDYARAFAFETEEEEPEPAALRGDRVPGPVPWPGYPDITLERGLFRPSEVIPDDVEVGMVLSKRAKRKEIKLPRDPRLVSKWWTHPELREQVRASGYYTIEEEVLMDEAAQGATVYWWLYGLLTSVAWTLICLATPDVGIAILDWI